MATSGQPQRNGGEAPLNRTLTDNEATLGADHVTRSVVLHQHGIGVVWARHSGQGQGLSATEGQRGKTPHRQNVSGRQQGEGVTHTRVCRGPTIATTQSVGAAACRLWCNQVMFSGDIVRLNEILLPCAVCLFICVSGIQRLNCPNRINVSTIHENSNILI